MTNEIAALWDAWLAAERLWVAEIVNACPRKWPGAVRYTAAAKGEPGTPLRAASDAWEAAKVAFFAAGGYDWLKRGKAP